MQHVGEQRSVGLERAAPLAAENVVQRHERRVRPAPQHSVRGVAQPDPVGVRVPVPAAARLLVALHRHPAQGHLDVDGGLREGEGKGDVQRLLLECGRLADPVLDIDPRELVVQRDDGRDAGAALQPPLDQEALADARQSLTAGRRELGLAQGEVGGGAELVGRRIGPEGAVATAANVHQLV